MTLLIDTINDVCNMAVPTAIMGGVGYLAGRLVKQVDPRVSAVCFAIAGFAGHLISRDDTIVHTRIVSLAFLVSAPLYACQALNIAATRKATLIASGVGIILFLAAVAIKKDKSGEEDDF